MSLLGIVPDRSGPAAPLPAPPVPPAPTAGSIPVTAVDGTPVTAPATRHAFAPPEARDRDPASPRKWRMSDIVAAIGGGPRAELLIEAASRPGPVAPGSLLEAIKALRPAPTLPQSTWTV